MQKKLNLIRADKYAFHICADLIAKMVVAHLDGLPGPQLIGCEQGDIPAWDDIVQLQHDGSLLQIQVKRQLDNFKPAGNSIRAIKANSTTEYQELTPFDKSIAALADWFSPTSTTNKSIERHFSIHVPDLSVSFKKELTMWMLGKRPTEPPMNS